MANGLSLTDDKYQIFQKIGVVNPDLVDINGLLKVMKGLKKLNELCLGKTL